MKIKKVLSNAMGIDKQNIKKDPMKDAQKAIADIVNVSKKIEKNDIEKLNGKNKDLDFIIEHYLGYNFGYRGHTINAAHFAPEEDIIMKDINSKKRINIYSVLFFRRKSIYTC